MNDVLQQRRVAYHAGLEVGRYGPLWHTGTSLVGLKAYTATSY